MEDKRKGNWKSMEFRGERKSLKEFCTQYGINYKTAHVRLSRGWTKEEALTDPLKFIGNKKKFRE